MSQILMCEKLPWSDSLESLTTLRLHYFTSYSLELLQNDFRSYKLLSLHERKISTFSIRMQQISDLILLVIQFFILPFIISILFFLSLRFLCLPHHPVMNSSILIERRKRKNTLNSRSSWVVVVYFTCINDMYFESSFFFFPPRTSLSSLIFFFFIFIWLRIF